MRRWTWWLAWSAWVAALALDAAALAIQQLTGHPEGDQPGFTSFPLLVAFTGFATVGALVAPRAPRNAVGWIFLAIGLLVGLCVFGEVYASWSLVDHDGGLSATGLAAWLYFWTWFPALALVMLVPLLFPDGRVPGPRWRPLLRAMVAVVGLVTALLSLDPRARVDPPGARSLTNPVGVDALRPLHELVNGAAAVVFVGFLFVSATSMVVRFRRSRGEERQQLKWVTYGVVVMAVGSFLPALIPDGGDLGLALTLAVFPAATAVAMLRYRLYDIDRLISRTLSWAALTALLGIGYVALVLAGQAVFSSFAGGSNLAIAVSTLVVAALFLPLRSRVQRVVDRRFYRRRYDAQRTLAAFGSRLRDRVDVEGVQADLAGVVSETMQPAHVSLWLKEERA